MRGASTAIQRVSIADKVHNARSILADWHQEKDAVWSKFKGGKEGTLWFYQAFLQLHQGKTDSYLATELERVVSQLLYVCQNCSSCLILRM